MKNACFVKSGTASRNIRNKKFLVAVIQLFPVGSVLFQHDRIGLFRMCLPEGFAAQ